MVFPLIQSSCSASWCVLVRPELVVSKTVGDRISQIEGAVKRPVLLFLTATLLAKVALAYLPTALFVALRPLFSIRQSQYAQVFLLKSAPFCKLFADLGSTNNSSIFFLLLSSIFPFISISLVGTVFSLLLFYQTTMGGPTLVSPEERHGC